MEEIKQEVLKKITKQDVLNQIEQSKTDIQRLAKEVADRTNAIEQSRGVLNYANHLLKQFDFEEENGNKDNQSNAG